MIKKISGKLKKFLRQKPKKIQNPISWGIIGTGYMAETFSTVIDYSAEGVVSAVASRSLAKAEMFAKKHGKCTAYGSYQDLVSDDRINIIYVATPTVCHYENIKLCLEHGKNVLCEKPITFNMREIMELRSLAQEKNCFLMEGMWMKCLPTYQKAIEWVNSDRIGKVELIKVDFYKREIVNPELAIFNSEMGGGVLRDYGVYAVAFPLEFMDTLSVIEGKYRKSKFGIDTDWQIHFSDEKIDAFISLSSDFKSLSKAAIVGDCGVIEWESQFNRTNKISLYDVMGNIKDVYEVNYMFEGFEYELKEVHYCLLNGLKESNVVPLKSSIDAVAIVDSLLKRRGC